MCGVAALGRVLRYVLFACGETGSGMMTLACAMDAIQYASSFPQAAGFGKIYADVLALFWMLLGYKNSQQINSCLGT